MFIAVFTIQIPRSANSASSPQRHIQSPKRLMLELKPLSLHVRISILVHRFSIASIPRRSHYIFFFMLRTWKERRKTHFRIVRSFKYCTMPPYETWLHNWNGEMMRGKNDYIYIERENTGYGRTCESSTSFHQSNLEISIYWIYILTCLRNNSIIKLML